MGDLLTGRKNQLNALALIGMFSLSSFCYYLISFYMADSPGDKYLNFAYVGLGDAFAAFFTKKLQDRLPIRDAFKYSICLLLCCSLAFIACVDSKADHSNVTQNNVIASFILLLRVFVCCCFGLSYQMAYLLFPPLLRSKALSLANGVARPLTMLAPFMIRVPNPMSLLVAASFLYFVILSMVTMPSPEEMKGFNGAKEVKKDAKYKGMEDEDTEQLLKKSI